MKYLALSFCLLFAAQAADWPRFLGPDGTSMSAETGINKDWQAKPPKELWRQPLSDNGHAGPAVANGVVYMPDFHLEKDDAGKPLAASGQAVLHALDLTTGKEIWRHAFPEQTKENFGLTRATPLVSDGIIYTNSMNGTVTAIRAASGDTLWQRQLLEQTDGKPPRWGVSNSLIRDGETLYALSSGENALLIALDCKTGKTRWTGGGTDVMGYATPLITDLNDQKQIVTFSGTTIRGSATNGEPLWSLPWKTKYDVNAAMPAPVGDDQLLITSGYRNKTALVKVKGDATEFVWVNKKINTRYSSPVVYEGHAYTTTEPGYLVCFSLSDGSEKWRTKSSDGQGFEHGAVTAVDGTLIALSGNTGAVVMAELSPHAYNELGYINPLQDKQCWAAPVISKKKLLVRSPRALVCLDLAK